MNRKLALLVMVAAPTILLSGCLSTLHRAFIHVSELTQFAAAVKTLAGV